MEGTSMIKLQYVGWHPPESFWIGHLEKESEFLCKKDSSIFVSRISKSDSLSYYVNCAYGCVPISNLDEIHLITEGKL
jgi:hypothetical protein